VPLDGDQRRRRLYPILVRGSHTQGRQTDLSAAPSDTGRFRGLAHEFKHTSRNTTVKWFPGTKMHDALRIAAKTGPESVKRLLTSAGNDIKLLDACMPLTNFISQL
jgi:hypothetical protein